MNPLTQIKNTQKASKYEIAQGFSESASWHARFKHSAYIFAGGLPFDLTEGDLLAIFAQYGELVDINLVKDKDTGARGPGVPECTPMCLVSPAHAAGCSIDNVSIAFFNCRSDAACRQAARICICGI